MHAFSVSWCCRIRANSRIDQIVRKGLLLLVGHCAILAGNSGVWTLKVEEPLSWREFVDKNYLVVNKRFSNSLKNISRRFYCAKSRR